MPKSAQKEPAEEPARQDLRREYFRKELLGIFLGVSVAMMVSSLVPQIRENVNLWVVILWGGAIGGLLVNYDRFERAGAVLTKSENTFLNYAIGLGLPAAVLLLVYSLTR